MDFIERWFGVSPDAGSGALEAFYVVGTLAVAIMSVLTLRSVRSRQRKARELRRQRP